MKSSVKSSVLYALAIATAFTAQAFAQTPAWPPKQVKIIVPFAAGATPDLVARFISEDLQARYPGTVFIVENKPGASGNIGTDMIAKSKPDGSTIGVSLGGPLAINTILYPSLPYSPGNDIAPITMLTSLPSVLAVPASLGVNSVADFVALVKKDPTKIAFGSIGNGSLSHLTMEAISLHAATKLTHVPYGGSPQAVLAVMRGDVQAAVLPAISVTTQLPSGQIKILAVATAKRSRFLPDIPTLKESGIDVESDAWNALIAPAGTPAAVIKQINQDIVETLEKPGVRARLEMQLIDPAPSTPDELRARIESEVKLWADIIKRADVKIN